MSDITGLSSLDGANSTTDEFEYQEKMLRCEENEALKVENERDSGFVDVNRTYDVDDGMLKDEDGHSDDDNDEVFSTASTKTFKKSSTVDLDELCQCQEADVLEFGKDQSSALTEETVECYKIKAEDGKSKDKSENKEAREVEVRLPMLPKKCISMPNIADMKAKATPRFQKPSGKQEEEATEQLSRNNREKRCGNVGQYLIRANRICFSRLGADVDRIERHDIYFCVRKNKNVIFLWFLGKIT